MHGVAEIVNVNSWWSERVFVCLCDGVKGHPGTTRRGKTIKLRVRGVRVGLVGGQEVDRCCSAYSVGLAGADFERVCVYVTFRAYYFLGMPFLRQGTCNRIQATSDYYASFACSYEISIVRVE